jgi:hypothetical protein
MNEFIRMGFKLNFHLRFCGTVLILEEILLLLLPLSLSITVAVESAKKGK